ncbi:hypothetical protein P4E94_19445 [Pontiellaceae bacterium B12219]|nr:hypothetical protein [Pontiellaceae bacterium B12219]
MDNLIEERYVFWRLAIHDFSECTTTLELISTTSFHKIKMALFKSAIIAYCRPFSGNQAKYKKNKWKIDEKWVVDRDLHQELMDLRSQLFAHTDITYRNPKLAPFGDKSIIAMKGFYYETAMELVEPTKKLCTSVRNILLDKIAAYEKENF